ncbi:hypothetical protein DMUE_0592 [Dictyocoela muelleri]|nr:hypothetical protein DMUE_0592 [Dictyocoela muelleri]
MGRNVVIENEEKRINIIVFLRSKKYPPNITKKEKHAFRRMCSKFEIVGNELFYNNNEMRKKFIFRYERSKIKEIIEYYHSQDHVGPRGTYERINNIYTGIIYDDVVEIISNFENCMRERYPEINKTVTPIVPSYQREAYHRHN